MTEGTSPATDPIYDALPDDLKDVYRLMRCDGDLRREIRVLRTLIVALVRQPQEYAGVILRTVAELTKLLRHQALHDVERDGEQLRLFGDDDFAGTPWDEDSVFGPLSAGPH